MTLNIFSWSSAGYWKRTCFAERTVAPSDCLFLCAL